MCDPAILLPNNDIEHYLAVTVISFRGDSAICRQLELTETVEADFACSRDQSARRQSE